MIGDGYFADEFGSLCTDEQMKTVPLFPKIKADGTFDASKRQAEGALGSSIFKKITGAFHGDKESMEFLEMAGLDPNNVITSAHSVRNTSITMLLADGEAPTSIPTLSGHKEMDSIMRYDGGDHETLKRFAHRLAKATGLSTGPTKSKSMPWEKSKSDSKTLSKNGSSKAKKPERKRRKVTVSSYLF